MPGKIKLYCLYDKKQKKLLAEMETQKYYPFLVVGAVDPKTDGNHFKRLILSGTRRPRNKKDSRCGIEGWWEWFVCTNYSYISEEFPFEEENIEIRELEMKPK